MDQSFGICTVRDWCQVVRHKEITRHVLSNRAAIVVLAPTDVQGHRAKRLLAYLLRQKNVDGIVNGKGLIKVRQEARCRQNQRG
jgi:hypothetical protein